MRCMPSNGCTNMADADILALFASIFAWLTIERLLWRWFHVMAKWFERMA